MFDRASYSVITATVDKVAWYYLYPTWEGDFYEVLVQAALERAFYFLHNRNGVAEVNIETKGHRDQRIKEKYRLGWLDGYPYIGAQKIQSAFKSRELNVLKKGDVKPGCQMADLLAAPAMRHTIYQNTGRERPSGEYTVKLCDILETKKFYREDRGGKIYGPHNYGRIWRPKLK